MGRMVVRARRWVEEEVGASQGALRWLRRRLDALTADRLGEWRLAERAAAVRVAEVQVGDQEVDPVVRFATWPACEDTLLLPRLRSSSRPVSGTLPRHSMAPSRQQRQLRCRTTLRSTRLHDEHTPPRLSWMASACSVALSPLPEHRLTGFEAPAFLAD